MPTVIREGYNGWTGQPKGLTDERGKMVVKNKGHRPLFFDVSSEHSGLLEDTHMPQEAQSRWVKVTCLWTSLPSVFRLLVLFHGCRFTHDAQDNEGDQVEQHNRQLEAHHAAIMKSIELIEG